MDMMIGGQIASLRKKKKITQEELAKVLSVSNQAVSKWESGICNPDIQLLPRIADYFGVSLDDLFLIRKNKSDGQAFPHPKSGAPMAERLNYAIRMDKYAIDCVQKAKAAYENIISEGRQEHPQEYDQAQERLVRLCCRNGEGEACVEKYKKYMEQEPDDWRAYYLLALAYQQTKKEQEAWDILCRAFAKRYQSHALFLLAGDVCRALKMYPEAILYWQQAYHMDEDYCTPLYSLAYLYEKCKDYHNAIEMWGKIIAWRHAHGQDENHELDWPLVKIKELQKLLKSE